MSLSPAYGNGTTVMLSLQESLMPQLEAVASNLSNAGTVGFKGLLVTAKEAPQDVSNSDPISFVTPTTVHIMRDEGPIKKTGNELDVAIKGLGFFQVEGGNYTRNGQMKINSDGLLSTMSDKPILGNGGSSISIPPGAGRLTISTDGTVSSAKGVLGKLGTIKFNKDTPITPLGNGLYQIDGSGTQDTTAKFVQGSLEESNVNPIAETIRLIEVQRRYEQAQKAIDAEDARQRQVLNVSASNA